MSAARLGTQSHQIVLDFDDNALVPILYGEHDRNLARIEQVLGVSLFSRGNRVTVVGTDDAVRSAEAALNALWRRLQKQPVLDAGDVDAALRMAATVDEQPIDDFNRDELEIRTKRRRVTPRTPVQAAYIRTLRDRDLVFGLGPAGTGKTYLAVATAVAMMVEGKVDRLILSRPAVEAGERLGFLPGDLKEKIDPYLRPLYDALHDMLPADQVMKRLESGEIEIAPLAFMRGRTLSNAYVILDEAQNTTPMQMKMFLTRIGENSRMAITGDISQVDLPRGAKSGLREAIDVLTGVDGIGFVRFTDADIVRHPLVTRIVQAYDRHDRQMALFEEKA